MMKFLARIKAFWNSLPHPVQAMLCFAATTAGTAFVRAVSDGNCYSWICLKHSAFASVVAGLAVVRAFYMLPNGTSQLVAQAKAANTPGNPPPQV